MNRVEYLLNIFEKDSIDPFIPYALALEFISLTEIEKALSYFEYVEQNFKDYLPLYYSYAEFLFSINKEEEGLEIAKKGLTLAKDLRNNKTASELSNLIFEWE